MPMSLLHAVLLSSDHYITAVSSSKIGVEARNAKESNEGCSTGTEEHRRHGLPERRV